MMSDKDEKEKEEKLYEEVKSDKRLVSEQWKKDWDRERDGERINIII